jgi:ribosomal protein S18 acetylase RimI-like enzyme
LSLEIARVGASDIDELAPLMRAYCEFYGTATPESALRALSERLLASPETDGLQLLARDGADAPAVGFATVFWTLSTLSAAPIGLMNDLYVAPAARGRGIGSALIDACVAECHQRGLRELEWYTAPDNTRAQAVYDRTGATREEWVSYSLALG